MSKSSLQIKGLSLDRLESLARVVRNGGVFRAAEGNANRQSLYSRQIQELEAAMGITLMDRSSSPHKPTQAAMALVESTEALFRQLNLLKEEADSERTSLVIGAGDRMIRSYLLPFLARHDIDNTQLVMRNLKSSAIRAGLINHSIHIGILRASMVPPDCTQVKLKPIEIGLYAPVKMRLPRSKTAWKKIAASPLVMMEGEGVMQKHVAECFHANAITLDVAMQCSSWFQVAEAMKLLNLAGILPRDVARSLGDTFFECAVPGLADFKDAYVIAWSPALAKKNAALAQWVKLMSKGS